ncbi:hypothetical protein Sipo8835_40120 [Streptomyces ipomoeae]|jgi:hypothetical protein|uniref:DUF5709 domain-containing protein n=2 Tax=Streptomyces ipomoeae TaxID=103232 RepID=L1L009_9ACTN|nr:DUF5709 domain-containing protein [Streptomyces ipomoeae]EKX66391.1 hypothetical protein STRIP9103_08238 [Streptomyces ipomoeae 91-03]MDX2694507.1 hypothetical protein [Streptomyces ipomoeae]MDX2823313.1 hypothetical protein [Streptomyces ipomoeae]MDX2843911.1 hypothetical protein [Streptomyces ipomoeae]MDX2874751.1 hypothetical protein [Streptomyces ipomoeae]
MSRRPHDPGADPEDEGMPDLQDGTPEQQWSSDPQQLPVAGDEPTIAEVRDTTVNEVIERESLDERLADEEPEIDPGAEPGEPEAPAGLLYDEPDPDLPRDQDVYSQEGATSGLSAEEAAVRIRDEEDFGDDELT